MSTDAHPPSVDIERLLSHRRWLRALARSLVGNASDADDVVQDTWLAALRRPPRDAGASRSWLRTVAKNVVRDRHRVETRRTRREEVAARPEALGDGTDVVAIAELQKDLTRHVLALEEPYRTTILLRFFEDLPPRDVAARMGVPVETVRTRVRRGLEQLREALEAEHGHGDAWRIALLPLVAGAPTSGPAAPRLARIGGALGGLAALHPAVYLSACALLLGMAVILVVTGEPPEPRETAEAPSPPSEPVPPAPDVEPAPAIAVDPPDAPETPPVTDQAGAAPPTDAPRDRTPRVLPPPLPGSGAAGGLVRFPATNEQVMGMDEGEVKAHLEAIGRDPKKWERFEYLWENGFLFFTPRHTVAVPEFEISRFEVTNAQWKVFLDDPVNVDSDVTQPGMTLKMIVQGLYEIDPEKNPVDAQRAGLYIYYRNEGRLMGALNPDADPDWEPLEAWVEDAELPAGTRIEFTHVLPPPYWKRGEVPEDELDKPVRYLSWNDARQFCRWAGLHIPLEREWERTARGDRGRTLPWGDEWNPRAAVWKHFRGPRETNAGPEVVDSLADFATPEGVHHLLGNVSEYVFDFARRYPGSASSFAYENAGMLARGGMWDDEDYVMLAADRIWDVGTSQIGPDTRADGFGFRYAAYPQPGRDLALELVTYAVEFERVSGPATWLPYPPGLSERDRVRREKRAPLQGFSLDRTAGWLERDLSLDAPHHAIVRGPARGIAFVPIKGLLGTFLKDKGRFVKLSLDDAEVALVGALVSTDNCKIRIVNEAGEAVELDLGDRWSALWARHELGFRYPVGAWLVLRGERIAVYAGDGSSSGVFGAHLEGEPLGYLADDYVATWAITTEAPPVGGYAGGVATLSAPIPQLEKDGTVRRNGKSVQLTIKVPATFE